jgi:general secretion pathway protein A
VSFTPGALDVVFKVSGGVPRLINLVCDRALLAGFVSSRRQIDADMTRAAAKESLGNGRSRSSFWRRWSLPIAAGVAGALLPVFLPRSSGGVTPTPAPVQADAVPAAAPASPASSPARDDLGPLLLSLERGASFEGAVSEVQALWGGSRLERTPLRTHLGQVRRLNLPVVLEMFHPTRRDTCYVALLRLEGPVAIVSGGGGTVRVPVDELDRLWTRQALFLWRDFDALGSSAPGRTQAWTRERLAQLGYADADFGRAVSAFQRDAELAVDGVVGTRTLMTLYSRGAYARPRLEGAS